MLLKVDLSSDELVERNENNEVFTTSLKLAKKFNKRHGAVLRKIENLTKDTFTKLKIVLSEYVNEQGKADKMYILNRDAWSFIAMGFTGKNADKFKLEYIDAFNKMEEHIIKMVRAHNRAIKKDWLEHRHEAATEYKLMQATLKDVRLIAGKYTQHFHYANEAKLVNWAMTGEYGKLDRKLLSIENLNILVALEIRNAVLLGAGLGRDQRKLALKDLVEQMSMKLSHANSHMLNGSAA